MLALLLAVSCCTVVDGDTIKDSSGQRIRLLGIDAPELHKCPKTRVCAPGDPVASKNALQRLISGPVEVQQVTRDKYRRPVAIVRVRGVNLSCAQIASGNAIYVAKWDNGRLIAKECPLLAR